MSLDTPEVPTSTINDFIDDTIYNKNNTKVTKQDIKLTHDVPNIPTGLESDSIPFIEQLTTPTYGITSLTLFFAPKMLTR